MKILIEGETKEIAELIKTIRQENKIVTYGDIFKATYGENFTAKKNQSDDATIADAPLVVVVQTDKVADFWH